MKLWNKQLEADFFNESVNAATLEQVYYITNTGQYLAYWPKRYKGKKSTLQSRNTLVGSFTEKWTTGLVQEIVSELGLHAVRGAVCNEIALTNRSPADVLISKSKGKNQRPDDILAIIEVKMSIVWNWKLQKDGNLICIGDYRTHQGNPGLLRSDSMLKAIGKCINIRVSNFAASRIPIIVMGNTPITESYFSKVDKLKTAGIVQGFWSVNPEPLDNNGDSIKKTTKHGFYRFDDFEELKGAFHQLLSEERNFFSSMRSKKELGRIIKTADVKNTYEEKAELFLELIRE